MLLTCFVSQAIDKLLNDRDYDTTKNQAKLLTFGVIFGHL